MAVFEIAVMLVLIALNGLFALSELAVVSARCSRLRALAQEGRKVIDDDHLGYERVLGCDAKNVANARPLIMRT